MNNKMDFKIFPVFNQCDTIWQDFLHIEIMCDKNMGYNSAAQSKDFALRMYIKDWEENDYNFAFAAYDKKQMIGFAKGFLVSEKETYLDCLYVLPKYHGIGIGTQLLKATETTSSIVAERMSLTSLSSAINFYKQNGYDFSAWGDNCRGYMVKNLSLCTNVVVPVFHSDKDSFCIKFNAKVNDDIFKQNKYQPTFVYVNEIGRIDGVAICTKDGENKFWFKKGQDSLKIKLLSALNKVR